MPSHQSFILCSFSNILVSVKSNLCDAESQRTIITTLRFLDIFVYFQFHATFEVVMWETKLRSKNRCPSALSLKINNMFDEHIPGRSCVNSWQLLPSKLTAEPLRMVAFFQKRPFCFRPLTSCHSKQLPSSCLLIAIRLPPDKMPSPDLPVRP